MIKYFCCSEHRRKALKNHATLNGIDFLEVKEEVNGDKILLTVHFIKDLSVDLTKDHIHIEGAYLLSIDRVDQNQTQPKVLKVIVGKPTDLLSTYTLHLRKVENFDPLLSSVDFSFKIISEQTVDCWEAPVNLPARLQQPELDYLSRDFASFRQLMLDRLAMLIPDWQARTPADLGITLVELLAYVGDFLSYQLDAVATEAYLETARRRVSVRRHVRLVDYFMLEGSNARVWAQIRVSEGGQSTKNTVKLPFSLGHIHLAEGVRVNKGTQILTGVLDRALKRIQPGSSDYNKAMAFKPEVFETLYTTTLYGAHNEMTFYTWGACECVLPAGATKATLSGCLPKLKPGYVLIFQEVIGPQTGEKEDVNLAHRHAVRLTKVVQAQDPLGGQFQDPPVDNALDVTEIEWAPEDALPFPLCISTETDTEHGRRYISDVSIALGNIVLADHGRTICKEDLGIVPEPRPELARIFPGENGRCGEPGRVIVPPRYYPRLQGRPLTFAASCEEGVSAKASMRWPVQDTRPVVTLHSQSESDGVVTRWHPERDLLNSSPSSSEFVVETESDGSAFIRFGDDRFGRRPRSGTRFMADYRVGHGTQGNIGADSLSHIVSSDDRIVSVNNPLPAQGGLEPESLEDVRQRAPYAFRQQERAVTAEDYAKVAARHPEVQRAAAKIDGNSYTVTVAVDRLGGLRIDDEFKRELCAFLKPFRMVCHNLNITGPEYVFFDIEMTVQVKPGYLQNSVHETLLKLFSNRILPDGRRGLFHPDNFTFGQPVYLSHLYAAAMTVEGVESVVVTIYKYKDEDLIDRDQIDGDLTIEPLKIAHFIKIQNLHPEGGK